MTVAVAVLVSSYFPLMLIVIEGVAVRMTSRVSENKKSGHFKRGEFESDALVDVYLPQEQIEVSIYGTGETAGQ